MREEGRALLRELDAARRAAQQRGLQLRLQAAERTAHAGDGLLQQFRRGSDGAGVDDGHESLPFLERGLHWILDSNSIV